MTESRRALACFARRELEIEARFDVAQRRREYSCPRLAPTTGPTNQGGGGPLPTQFDQLNADYFSFTLDGLFPVS